MITGDDTIKPARADTGRGQTAKRAPRKGFGVLSVFRFARTLFRAFADAWNKDATERAAALTYYAVLALFPALLMTVSLIGLAGGTSTGSLSSGLTALLPGESRPLVADALHQMAENTSKTVGVAAAGGAGAVWSACSYAGVFRRALHTVYGVVDHRPAWRTAPRIVLTSLTLLALLVVSALCVVVTGDLARRLGGALHLAGPTVSAWRGLRWPLLLVVAATLVLVLFRSGPRGTRSLRSIAPGGAVAVALWLLVSAGFAAYTSRMSTYNRLYGPLAGTVVFLVWLWLSHLALMVGVHFNVEHRAAVAARRPAAQPGPGDG